MKKRKLYLICFSALALGMALAFLKNAYAPKTMLSIELEMNTSQGQYARLYINKDWYNPLVFKIQPGKKYLYTSKILTEQITSLRLDPSDDVGAEIQFYGMRMSDGKQETKITPEELSLWNGENLRLSYNVNDKSTLILPSKINFWAHKDRLFFDIQAKSAVQEMLESDNFLHWLITCSLISLLMLGSNWAVPIVNLVFFLISFFLFGRIFSTFSFISTLPAVDSALGQATFLGHSKLNEFVIFFSSLSIAVLFAYISGHLFSNKVSIIDKKQDQIDSAFSWGDLLFLGSFFIFIFIIQFPGLSQIFEALPHHPLPADWDGANFVTWHYMETMGWLPYKDFWYPYAGFYNLSGMGPGSFLRSHLHTSFMWLCVVSFTYFLNDRRKILAILSYGLFFTLWQTGIIQSPERYLLATIPFGISLVVERFSKNSIGYLIMGFIWGWVIVTDPFQFLYSFSAIIIVYMLKNVKSSRSDFYQHLKGYSLTFCSLGTVLIGQIIIWSARGQLSGVISFYQEMKGLTEYSSSVFHVEEWYKPSFSYDNIFWLSVHALLFWGVFHFFKRNQSTLSSKLWEILLGFSLISIFVCTKQIVRPNIAVQIISIPALGLLIYFLKSLSQFNRRQIFASSLLLGFLLIAFEKDLPYASLLKSSFIRNPEILKNMTPLFKADQEIRSQMLKYYSTSNFYCQSEQCKGLFYLLDELKKDGGENSVFILGDESLFYLFMQAKPPYFLSLYNTSPISAQQKQISYLEKTQPKWVLWNKDAKDFDLVPNTLRVPLLYQYVRKNYEYEKQYHNYIVLSRAPEGSVDDTFWNKFIGTENDLGYLPSTINYQSNEDCVRNEEGCEAILLITRSGSLEKDKLSFSVNGPGGQFSISFIGPQGKNKFVIPLYRLWFYDKSQDPVQMTFNLPDNLTLEIKNIKTSPSRLY